MKQWNSIDDSLQLWEYARSPYQCASERAVSAMNWTLSLQSGSHFLRLQPEATRLWGSQASREPLLALEAVGSTGPPRSPRRCGSSTTPQGSRVRTARSSRTVCSRRAHASFAEMAGLRAPKCIFGGSNSQTCEQEHKRANQEKIIYVNISYEGRIILYSWGRLTSEDTVHISRSVRHTYVRVPIIAVFRSYNYFTVERDIKLHFTIPPT